MASKVFLGGTCNGSDWRQKLIPLLEIEYFDPVVPDWTEDAYQEELRQRDTCDFVLYVLDLEKMAGVYSIAELVDDSNKRPGKTVACVLGSLDNDVPQDRSVKKVLAMASANGAVVLENLEEVAKFLNQHK